jgi:hypothetical protein
MATNPISYYGAPALLAASAVLAAGNWYLQPERAAAWASAVLLIGCMSLAFLLAPRRAGSEAARRRGDSIRNGIVFAGLILVISLGMKLATALGAIQDADLARRATMVILGGFLAFTGNTMPKTHTPLSALQCDAARAQAFQRFAGWSWVLTGLALAVVWLVLPLDLAKPVSLVLLMSSMLMIVAEVVRLRRTRQRNA